MSYDQAKPVTYSFPTHDFGAGGDSMSVRGPAGKNGRLTGIQVRAIGEAFNAVTTPAQVLVGTAGNTDAFGLLNVGVLADTDSINEAVDTDAIISEHIPPDTQVEITFVAPTGGTPAGIGQAEVTIEWW